jgi:hypothetical protein
VLEGEHALGRKLLSDAKTRRHGARIPAASRPFKLHGVSARNGGRACF